MNIKSVLMAGAAALASTASLAADLPSAKSAPVEYVRICDVYGRGFFYIPGTQTCLRIGGLVRFEISGAQIKNSFNYTNDIANPGFNATQVYANSRNFAFTHRNGIDSLGWESRGRLDMDARTQTAWGTVQTVTQLRMTSASASYNTGYNTANFAASNTVGVTLTRAFIRFGGFTFGRAAEIFNFDSFDQYVSHRRPGFANGAKQLAYTATFGSGYSATLGIEARDDFNSARTGTALGTNSSGGALNSGGPVRTTATGPTRWPALVGNIRTDQSWGSAQIMAGAIQNTANFAAPVALGVTNANGPLVSKWGYAVGMGVKLKLDMIAPGDEFIFTAHAGKGAMEWVSNFSTSAITSDLGHILGGLQRVDNNMAVFGTNGGPLGSPTVTGAELTAAWSVAGMFRHNWSPTVASYFGASYVNITPGTVTRNTDWLQGGRSKATAYTLSKALVWYPIQGFELGAEVAYYKLNQRLATAPGQPPQAAPAGTGAFSVSPSTWRYALRAERRF